MGGAWSCDGVEGRRPEGYEMFCPKCRGEFRPEVEVCPDCSVSLVAALPAEEHDLEPFVTVFETSESAVLPVVESLLEGSGIPFLIRNEETMGLFPTDGVGLIIDPASRAAQVDVPARHAEAAKELLVALPVQAVEPE